MSSKEIDAKYVWSSVPETKRSTSSGAFYLISKTFLSKNMGNAVVYGCAFDENNNVRHIRIDRIEELYRLQGSKYVQSDMQGVYEELYNDLASGRYVLFSGTACQVAAVSLYAKKYRANLFTIDVLCHGVPSPQFWNDYVAFLEKKYKGKLFDIRFRNKSNRNRLGYLLTFKVNGRNKKIFVNESVYYTSFINSTSLRPSCYKCPFVGDYEYSNVTLCDSNTKLFHPFEAISLLIIRDEKGRQLFESIKSQIEYMDANVREEAILNKKLAKSTSRPEDRCNYSIGNNNDLEIKNNIKDWLLNRIKNFIPTRIKQFYKR